MTARLFTEVRGSRTTDNLLKLKQERFRQDIKKRFFTLRTAKQGCLVSVPVGYEDPNG